MNNDYVAEILRATGALRSGDRDGVGAVIHNALAAAGLMAPAGAVRSGAAPGAEALPPRSNRLRKPLSEVVRTLRSGGMSGLSGLGQPAPTPELPLPDGAAFLDRRYSCAAGARRYRLYVPSNANDGPQGLIVMLHGCTQDPDDFAAGTKMNELAEKRHCLVLYPAQTGGANVSKCWNWFKGGDQQRDQGEPSIIAGMTCQVCDSHAVDQRRIYVAGLSAGGAMAMTMAVTYPELYAAVGIHSGLPHAVARDLPSALAAMQQGRAAPLGGDARTIAGAQAVAAIVFHGDRDTTVHPGNGDQVISQCMPPTAAQRTKSEPEPRVTVLRGQVPQGHAYTRTLYQRIDGQAIAEHWLIHGAGHAWSGGSASGSYTDPKGPDATGEMMRFFLENPRPEVAG